MSLWHDALFSYQYINTENKSIPRKTNIYIYIQNCTSRDVKDNAAALTLSASQTIRMTTHASGYEISPKRRAINCFWSTIVYIFIYLFIYVYNRQIDIDRQQIYLTCTTYGFTAVPRDISTENRHEFRIDTWRDLVELCDERMFDPINEHFCNQDHGLHNIYIYIYKTEQSILIL